MNRDMSLTSSLFKRQTQHRSPDRAKKKKRNKKRSESKKGKGRNGSKKDQDVPHVRALLKVFLRIVAMICASILSIPASMSASSSS